MFRSLLEPSGQGGLGLLAGLSTRVVIVRCFQQGGDVVGDVDPCLAGMDGEDSCTFTKEACDAEGGCAGVDCHG